MTNIVQKGAVQKSTAAKWLEVDVSHDRRSTLPRLQEEEMRGERNSYPVHMEKVGRGVNPRVHELVVFRSMCT